MAFDITLYNFQKDTNSTKVPADAGTGFQCLMITGSSVIAPTVQLDAADLTGYNYAYIPAFHRYYFIRDCRYSAGFWDIDLTCDVLATYKAAIGGSDLYILRSSAEFDGNIQDNYYPPTAEVVYSSELYTTHEPLDYLNGYYLVNIAGTQTVNGTLVQLSPANFKSLISALYTQIDQFQLSDVIENVVKSFGGNPERLISSVMWFPFPFVTPDDSEVIYIGSWLSGVRGDIVTNPLQILDSQISMPIAKHPQAARGQYLNLSPYMTYSLYLPGVGAVSLDTTQLIGKSNILITRLIDGFTGQIKYMVVTGGTDYHVLANVTGQWGVPIRLTGGSTGDSIVSGTLATLGSAILAATTGGASAVIGAASAAIGTITGAMSGAAYSNETGGGIVNLYQQPIRLDVTAYKIPDEDNARNGRPLCKVRKPSVLGGYMQAQKGDITASGATAAELDAIRTYLEGGFYYE